MCLAPFNNIINKIFREGEKPIEVVMEIIKKFLRENVMISKCKTPKEALGRKEYQIAKIWGIQ